MLNRYSSLLHTATFGLQGSYYIGPLEEYYERPVLFDPIHEDDYDMEDDFSTYKRFSSLRFRKFTLRLHHKPDSICFVDGHYMKVSKILCHRETKRVYITGRLFQTRTFLFDIPQWEGPTSTSVGIDLCSDLTIDDDSQLYDCCYISYKCIAFPYHSIVGGNAEGCEKWAIMRYLHC